MLRSNSSPLKVSAMLIMAVLCAIVLLLFQTACGDGNTAAQPQAAKASVAAPADLVTPGVLTVGSDTTYPPQESIDPSSKKAVGFDVDLITTIAARMGLRANIVSTDFTTIIDSLTNKRFDVVISGVTVNPDRQKKVDFVTYFNAGESLLVPAGDPEHLKSVTDLCGLQVGVQKGTVEQDDLTASSQQCVKNGKPPVQMTILQSQTEVVQLLVNRRVAATYQDSPVTDYYIKLNPGQFTVGGSVVNAAPEGIAVRKGDTSMFRAIQTSFNQVKGDGTYHKLIARWGLLSEEIADIKAIGQYFT